MRRMAFALFGSIVYKIQTMKLANAIEGGLAGATTISLIGETLRKIEGKPAGTNGLNGKKFKKRLKKADHKKPQKALEQYIHLAGDVLGAASMLGFSSIGKKKNAVLRGALLGAAAGVGAILLDDFKQDKDNGKLNGHEGFPFVKLAKDSNVQKALEVAMFTIGGMIAGKLVQGNVKKKKKRKK
jgi:hypothetical protein